MYNCVLSLSDTHLIKHQPISFNSSSFITYTLYLSIYTSLFTLHSHFSSSFLPPYTFTALPSSYTYIIVAYQYFNTSPCGSPSNLYPFQLSHFRVRVRALLLLLLHGVYIDLICSQSKPVTVCRWSIIKIHKFFHLAWWLAMTMRILMMLQQQ
ncbi:uncharacterized protein DS421_13g427890 [Arachis hypogaea]|nr:uncharacterized protein DS421_13g427890 [Arachis hypogaea]